MKTVILELDKELESLAALEDDLLKLSLRILNADGKFYPVDLIANAVIKRSLALISGFCTLIRAKTFFCAAPLVRLHLDSLLRFSAIWLVKDCHGLANDIWDGKHVRKLKDKKGNQMTDQYLVDCLAKENPWVKSVYEATSGYIHLSKTHIYNAHAPNSKPNEWQVAIGKEDEFIPDDIRIESCLAMKAITKKIIWYLDGWQQTKSGTHELSPKKLKKNQP
jgi:hypothetical protein